MPDRHNLSGNDVERQEPAQCRPVPSTAAGTDPAIPATGPEPCQIQAGPLKWVPWRIGPVGFRRLALASIVLLTAIILTGGVVRLTGSGLGCSDWPQCFRHHFVAPDSFHPLVEFSNRMFTIVLTAVLAATAIASLIRRPYRRDLAIWSWALVGGVFAQAILGGVVVLSGLFPPFVMLHFLLAIVMVGAAVVLHWRAGRPDTKPVVTVGPEVLWLSRLILLVLGAVLVAGTATAMAGPSVGSVGAQRLPVSFAAVAQLHADIVWLLIGLTLAMQFLVHHERSPMPTQNRAHILLYVMIAQGAIGYIQYFTHVPLGLVELHMFGATLVCIAAIRLHLGLFNRQPASSGAGASGAHRGEAAVLPAPTMRSARSAVVS